MEFRSLHVRQTLGLPITGLRLPIAREFRFATDFIDGNFAGVLDGGGVSVVLTDDVEGNSISRQFAFGSRRLVSLAFPAWRGKCSRQFLALCLQCESVGLLHNGFTRRSPGVVTTV